MPRYFMNLRYRPGPNGIAFDREGDEVVDETKLRERAVQVARMTVARDHLFTASNWLTCSFEVTDEAGQLVLTVPFRDIVSDDDDERQA